LLLATPGAGRRSREGLARVREAEARLDETADGLSQATYDGYLLYGYVGDAAPGQITATTSPPTAGSGTR
jgi:hypothetical protein